LLELAGQVVRQVLEVVALPQFTEWSWLVVDLAVETA
jgi:hypothetical protein